MMGIAMKLALNNDSLNLYSGINICGLGVYNEFILVFSEVYDRLLTSF